MNRLPAHHDEPPPDGREALVHAPDVTADVVDLAAVRRARTPDPSTFVPSHVARPMTNEQRRRNAERGIANARAALARARIREVRTDG